MPIEQLDPYLIRTRAAIGVATTEPDAIDVLIAKINEIIAGAGTGTGQVFRYTAAGGEANPLTVALPAERASANYNVFVAMGGPLANPLKLARALVSTFTTLEFQAEFSVPLQAGDIVLFHVADLT